MKKWVIIAGGGMLSMAHIALAQEVAEPLIAVASDPLVCVVGSMPGQAGSRGEVRLTIPASKLEKFEALQFTQVSCATAGKRFAPAGLTICQMRQKGNVISDADFQTSHRASIAQVCETRSKR